MRKLLILAALIAAVGCQSGPFAKKDRPRPAPDPLFSSDIEEQKRWDRALYSYPEHNPNIAPPTYADRPTPSGR